VVYSPTGNNKATHPPLDELPVPGQKAWARVGRPRGGELRVDGGDSVVLPAGLDRPDGAVEPGALGVAQGPVLATDLEMSTFPRKSWRSENLPEKLEKVENNRNFY
jgi:hypothetical protein